MTSKFHLSLAVPDLRAMAEFYANTLSCPVIRDAGTWLDIDFFGHQLTLHQAGDGIEAVAVDHFGPVLDELAWRNVATRCRASGAEFVMPPTERDDAAGDRSGKFLVRDPAGNLLEFKYL